jgi:hypothetical protein
MSRDRESIVRFHKRWDIPLDQDVEFERLKNRVLTAVDSTVGRFVVERPFLSQDFALRLGDRQPVQSVAGPLWLEQLGEIVGKPIRRSFADTAVYRALELAPDERNLIFALQCLFWLLADHKCPELHSMIAAVRKALDVSPFVEVGLATRGDRVTLHPKGARLLDGAVVNDTLAWLGNRAAVARHFENALQIYLEKNAARYRNVLDELRSALEKLLRSLLGNRRPLEKQEKPLLQWMQERGAHVHVRNLYWSLLGWFIKYQNEAVKHGDGWGLPEVEYMIYLTGTFMRLLLQLSSDTGS